MWLSHHHQSQWNLIWSAISMRVHIYMVLTLGAPLSPECPPGAEQSRSRRRGELVWSHFRIQSTSPPLSLEGATQSADNIFWNRCHDPAPDSLLHLGFQEEILRLTLQGPWLIFPAHYLAAKEWSLFPLELRLLDSGRMMEMSFNHLCY